MDERDQDTFDRFAKRYAAIDDVVPPRPAFVPRAMPRKRSLSGISVVGLAAVLVLVGMLLARPVAAPVGRSVSASPSMLESRGTGTVPPIPSAMIPNPAWVPAGWYVVRPHIWTLPVGPQLFVSNAPIADPCPTELRSADACRKPLERLPDNGVLVTLEGSAVPFLRSTYGQITTNVATNVCASLGGQTQMSSPTAMGFLVACVRGPDIAVAAASVRQIVASAVGLAASPQASLPAGISRDEAIRLAHEHASPNATFLDAEAGAFSVLDTHPHETGPGSPIKPSDLVWAVTYSSEMTICPPMGGSSPSPCWTPRPGLVVVYLDYVTGKFLMSQGSSPAP